MSVHCFYYWARRVRSQRSGQVRHRLDDPRDETARRAAAAALPVAGSTMVQFRLNAAVEVSVPAHCLEVIRCLAQCVQDARPVRGDAFREVVVSSR